MKYRCENRNDEIEKDNVIIPMKMYWAPMKIVQIYLGIVFILFVFGPWPWPVENNSLVYIYLISAQFLLYVGYNLSMNRRQSNVNLDKHFALRKDNKKIKIIKYLIILSFAFLVPSYLSRGGLQYFSITEFTNSFINGLINPGEQYFQRIQMTNQLDANTVLFLVIAVSAPFRWLFIPLSIVNWNSISRKYRLGLIIYIVLDTLTWISIGTNKGIFDNVFIIAFSLFIKISLDNISKNRSINNKNSTFASYLFSITILVLAIMYLIKAITSRLGSLNYYDSKANIYANFDSPLMLILPMFLKDALVIVTSYATQGYYGLSLAMKESFTSTYGFGNSWLLLSIYGKLTGNESIAVSTYPFKVMKYGWDPYINWHSIHSWLASDYSFVGTLFIMMIIGFSFGEIWKSVLVKKNEYAIGLFVLYMIMFMYFPANNQIFSYINTFAAFWGLFILWLFSNRKKRRIV